MSESRKQVNNSESDTAEDQYGSDNDDSMSVFKRVFKKYKRRAPPPDLTDVVDPRIERHDLGMTVKAVANYPELEPDLLQRLGLRELSEWKVTTFKGREGLFILPGILRSGSDVDWMRKVCGYAEPPNTTNMTIHGTSPESNVLRESGRRLRWTTLGVQYDWNTKEYPENGRGIPDELRQFGWVVARALGLYDMKADATIVNFYPPKTALSPHVDKSERSKAPLISLSLGQSAVYLSGGMSLDEEVQPLWLHSGDVLVMFGEQRLVYHAVPSIHPTRRFNVPDDAFLETYLNDHRINLTIRQVNP